VKHQTLGDPPSRGGEIVKREFVAPSVKKVACVACMSFPLVVHA